LESANTSAGIRHGFQPGEPAECPPRPELAIGGNNRKADGLSNLIAGGIWAQARNSISVQEGAALCDYARIHSLSLESFVAACWSELIRCYSGQASSVLLRIARATDPDTGAFEVSLPAAPTGSVRAWLSEVAKCIDQSAAGNTNTEPRRKENSRENLAEKLSTGTVVMIRKEGAGRCNELCTDLTRLLLLEALLNGCGLELRATYRADHFSAGFIEVLLGCLRHMLPQLPSLDTGPVSELELSAPSLRGRYISADNDRPAVYGTYCVHEQIREQARRSPRRVAAVSDREQITYGALNCRANRLARYLISHGAGPDSLVAVHLNRSIDLLVALVGILKAGAAFLPLDASLPKGRVAGILKDSQSPIVVTCAGLARSLWDSKARIVFIDSERDAWQRESGADFDSPAGMSDLAYVTYTSGSTGTPKGVMIEHRHLLASFAGMDGVLGTKPGVWLASSNISFDIAMTELLWTLVHGFQIVIHEGDEGAPLVSGSRSIAAQMRDHGVTHFQATPTLIRVLLSDPVSAATFAGLQKLLVGGEPFPPSLASTLLDTMPGDVFNMYGPTETTICATYHPLKRVQDPIPIGGPTINTRVYVLDKAGRIVPPLAPGELFLGGDAVGRGYFGRPDLTSERFTPDRFSGRPDARLYRTGDLVRVALDGTLEFLDRLDSQVKIRGFRIELGEIESALRAYPPIEDAAVVVRGEASGERTLAGFFTVRPGFDACLDEIANYLRRLLPSYMVPPSLTCLESFPLTANGKTDRANLAAGEIRQSQAPRLSATAYSSGTVLEVPSPDPRLRDIEATLLAWCSELLGAPEIEPTADFFEIGGQSLVAAQLVQRIAKRYRIHLRLSTFLKVRTMRALAELVHQDSNPAGPARWTPVVEVRGTGAKTPIFLIAGLGGSVVNFELLSRFLCEDRPVYAVETQGTNKNLEVLTSVEEMAQTYLEEVQRVQPQGPYHLCGYSFGGIIAFEMAQRLRTAGHEVGMVGLIDMPEWHYTRHVMGSFSIFERFRILYGGTIKRVLCGPNRLEALSTRLQATYQNYRIAFDRLRGRHPDPSVVTPEHRNFYALTHYRPKFYSGDIHLFRCPDPSRFRGADPLLGWGSLARRVVVSEIPGYHGSLTTEPFVGFLGKALRQSLDSLDTRPARKTKAGRAARTGEITNPLVTSV
jgi:amino acid adenylation domain-containing protein